MGMLGLSTVIGVNDTVLALLRLTQLYLPFFPSPLGRVPGIILVPALSWFQGVETILKNDTSKLSATDWSDCRPRNATSTRIKYQQQARELFNLWLLHTKLHRGPSISHL